MLARYLLTLIENPTREDEVNSTASIKEGSTEMEQGVDVHELLADLEEQLEKSIAIFAPAVAAVAATPTVPICAIGVTYYQGA